MKPVSTLLLLAPLLLTCCTYQPSPRPMAASPGIQKTVDLPQDPADRSCSYFYFLWGSHAEYNQDLEAALDAFEKALVCDPSATYIQKKIPILLIKMGEMDQAAEWLTEGIKQNPDDKAQYLLLAHLRMQQLKREEAIQLYQELLTRDPKDTGVLLRLGILYTQQNEVDKAENIFRDLLEQDSEEYFAHLYLARLLHLRQKIDEAGPEYEQALRLNWSTDLVFEMVDFYSNQEKYTDVLRLYTTILKNDPENSRAALGRVQTLMSLGEDQQALEELRKLRETSKEPAKLDMAISKLLLRLDKIAEAKVILEKYRKGENAHEAAYMLALIAFQAEDRQTALAYLATIPKQAEEYPESVYLRIRILRDEERTAEAMSLLLDSIADEQLRDPLYFALLSSLYQEQGKDSDALQVLIKGVEVFPDNEQVHFELALLLEKSGRHLDAVQSMQKVLELHPNHPEALNFIGYTWADQNINLDKAYEYIRQAVEMKPDNGFIRDSLGWIYFRKGEFAKAEQELLTAIKLEPDDPHIYQHLGQIYQAQSRIEDARQAYRKALELLADDEGKAAIQKMIDELEKK